MRERGMATETASDRSARLAFVYLDSGLEDIVESEILGFGFERGD